MCYGVLCAAAASRLTPLVSTAAKMSWTAASTPPSPTSRYVKRSKIKLALRWLWWPPLDSMNNALACEQFKSALRERMLRWAIERSRKGNGSRPSRRVRLLGRFLHEFFQRTHQPLQFLDERV